MAAKYDHIDFTPPAGVRDEAAKGLAWRSEYGRGGTAVGIARARDLSNGTTISPDTARRMKAYFDRHEIDKQGEGWSPGEPGFPSNGRIAWALWGGDPGYAWSRKLVEQMNAADEEDRSMNANAIERRSLVIDEVESDVPLLAVETRCEDGDTCEREWIVGYAAKFNTLSLDLGDFVERLAPTAFGLVTERRGRRKPLQTRALWNHDANFPLARYPETLRLTVDEVGLRYEFPVPDTTYGRDIAANIRAGIVKGSSFAFQVAKGGDEWSVEEGRSVRTIKAVDSLIDVSPTTFPAYPDSDVAVAKRSFDQFRQAREAVAAKASATRFAVKAKVAVLRKFMESRGFCPTGPGGGIDNSCGSKGGGGGGGGGGKSATPGALDSAFTKTKAGIAGQVLISDLKKKFPDLSDEQFSKMLWQGVEDGKYSMTPVNDPSMYSKEELNSGVVVKGRTVGRTVIADETQHLLTPKPGKQGEINASAAKHDAEQSKADKLKKADDFPPPKGKADKGVVDAFMGGGKPDTSVENLMRLAKIQAKMREDGNEEGAMALQAAVQEALKANPPAGFGGKIGGKPRKKS